MGRAVRLTDRLLNTFENELRELTLIPSSGGRFEVAKDGVVLFSKAALERHAEIDEMIEAVRTNTPIDE